MAGRQTCTGERLKDNKKNEINESCRNDDRFNVLTGRDIITVIDLFGSLLCCMERVSKRTTNSSHCWRWEKWATDGQKDQDRGMCEHLARMIEKDCNLFRQFLLVRSQQERTEL